MSESAAPASIDVIAPAGPVDAEIRPPGSKSISNRALLLAAISEGVSHIHGLLDADDTRHMLDALAQLGVRVEIDPTGVANGLRVEGRGAEFGTEVELDERAPLYVGTAGTVARFLTAVLAARGARCVVDGSPRMRERPMKTLFAALADRGAALRYLGEPYALPVALHAGGHFAGGRIELERPKSSQFVSALVFAATCGRGPTEILVRGGTPAKPYVDMTLANLASFGFEANWASVDEIDDAPNLGPEDLLLRVRAGGGRACDYAVEPDASAASYFLALATIYGGRISIPDLGRGSLQGDARFADVLARFGAEVEQDASTTTIRRSPGARALRGCDLDLTAMPDMTLTAAVVAAHAEGPTRLRGVEVLRHHESDRIAAGAAELRKLGCRVEEHEDGLSIEPPASGELRRGVAIETYDDHRMAMAFALAGEVTILDPGCAAKTFPGYFEELARFGMCSSPARGDQDV